MRRGGYYLPVARLLDRQKQEISPLNWKLFDLPPTKPNAPTVFSCFSCAGGSTMGYKLAGFNVIGNNEIDRGINKIYIKNHKPRYNFNVDIRNLLDQNLPSEMYNLDILDGSPPCSVFSINARSQLEKFSQLKRFREGQKEQRLDNLFFEFIQVADALRPKIVIAENVKGLILGNAKGYVYEILQAFDMAGYNVQIFLLNSAFMQVPQARERIFFTCPLAGGLHIAKI